MSVEKARAARIFKAAKKIADEGRRAKDKLAPGPNDLRVGRTYAAKCPRRCGAFWNDRQILHITDGDPRYVQRFVQYDSPTVGFGCNYRRTTTGAFAKWAGEDVTDRTPDGTWRKAE